MRWKVSIGTWVWEDESVDVKMVLVDIWFSGKMMVLTLEMGLGR